MDNFKLFVKSIKTKVHTIYSLEIKQSKISFSTKIFILLRYLTEINKSSFPLILVSIDINISFFLIEAHQIVFLRT